MTGAGFFFACSRRWWFDARKSVARESVKTTVYFGLFGL